MPKLGMEPIRRAALVEATIAELGAVGSLDITVSQIARRAGMSSALAHHYFGSKEDIFAAAMRRILADLQGRGAVADGRCEYARRTPARHHRRQLFRRVLRPGHDQRLDDSSTCCRAPARRRHSSCASTSGGCARTSDAALRPLSEQPEQDAETLAALIDGLYLRAALSRRGTPEDATRHALSVAHAMIKAST